MNDPYTDDVLDYLKNNGRKSIGEVVQHFHSKLMNKTILSLEKLHSQGLITKEKDIDPTYKEETFFFSVA